MDWNLAIEKNTNALTQIVAGLFVLVGLDNFSAKPPGSRPLTNYAALTRKANASRRRSACLPADGGASLALPATQGGQTNQSSKSSSYNPTPSSSGLTRGSTHKPSASLSACAVDPNNCLSVDSRIKSDYDDGNNVCVSKPEPNNFANITLGPITRRHLVSMLRTAEAALRRLIVLFVKVHGVKASAKTKRTRPLPDFASFGSVASNRPPVFNLFDPRKRLVFGFDEDTDSNPTNSSSSDLIGGSMHGPRIMFPHTHSVSLGVDPRVKAEDDDGVGSAEKLLKRLAALDHALKTLPQQAKRLVRTLEQRKNAPPGIKRIPPIRPGIPPGFRDRGKHEVDDVLRECHGLMRDIQMSPP